ncbi:MAG: hypothetical protein ACFE0J_08275 [Elainellaceae cyanobacterium]
MRLANPLYYPIPVLVGAIALFVGVRVARLPSIVMVPVSVAIATLGASIRKSQEPEGLGLDNPALERELKSVQNQAELVANQGEALRVEATRMLTELDELELLAVVQLACDRAKELPAKVDQLARRLHGSSSLLSIQDLQQQFKEVEDKLHASSGVAREQLQKLADTLRSNIRLAQEGQDARQAQVISLSTLILDAAGILQRLQNKLRTADLTNTSETSELRSLSNEFNHFQENVDLLIADDTHVTLSNSQPSHPKRKQV